MPVMDEKELYEDILNVFDNYMDGWSRADIEIMLTEDVLEMIVSDMYEAQTYRISILAEEWNKPKEY